MGGEFLRGTSVAKLGAVEMTSGLFDRDVGLVIGQHAPAQAL